MVSVRNLTCIEVHFIILVKLSANCFVFYLYMVYTLLLERYKLRNGLTAGDEIWRVRHVTPADENGLCLISIRVFLKKLENTKV